MNYHDIKTDNMDNGDGVRVVIWLSGCEHACPGCQNKEAWDCNSGKLFNLKAVDILDKELSKDYITGITFTGGDPLYPDNRFQVYSMIQDMKRIFPNKTIWLYTGYTIEDIIHECIIPMDILKCIDVIVDSPYIDSLRDTSLMWRGSPNQRVIDIKRSFFEGRIGIYSHIKLEPQVEKLINDNIPEMGMVGYIRYK